MDLISVIVPVYKVEKYLNRCIDSILGQTYKDFELILVDDGSPDNCGRICDEYAEKDSRIHVIHKKNGGLSDARNAGLDWAFEHSDSEWIAFVDSDDWIPNDSLSILYNSAINNNADLSFGLYQRFDDETYYQVDYSDSRGIITKYEFWGKRYSLSGYCGFNESSCASIACGKLYSKSLFENTRFEKGRLHEDEFILHKIINNCNKIMCVDKLVYYYYQRSDSIMGTRNLKSAIDYITAYVNRYSYFRSQKDNIDYFTELSLIYIDYMIDFYSSIYNKCEKNDEVVRSVKKTYNKIYLFLLKEKSFYGCSIRKKIDYFCFFVSYRFYNVVEHIMQINHSNI